MRNARIYKDNIQFTTKLSGILSLAQKKPLSHQFPPDPNKN